MDSRDAIPTLSETSAASTSFLHAATCLNNSLYSAFRRLLLMRTISGCGACRRRMHCLAVAPASGGCPPEAGPGAGSGCGEGHVVLCAHRSAAGQLERGQVAGD